MRVGTANIMTIERNRMSWNFFPFPVTTNTCTALVHCVIVQVLSTIGKNILADIRKKNSIYLMTKYHIYHTQNRFSILFRRWVRRE